MSEAKEREYATRSNSDFHDKYVQVVPTRAVTAKCFVLFNVITTKFICVSFSIGMKYTL